MEEQSEHCESVNLPEIELFDLIEYEENGRQRLAYHIGDGQLVLLEKRKAVLQADGFKHKEICLPVGTIDTTRIVEWKKIASRKYKIKREEVKWRKVEDGIDDIKEHNVIEIERSPIVRHFALCSSKGKAVDLNPKQSTYFIGNPPFSSFSRDSRESSDIYGVLSGEKPKFANGIIRERAIVDVINNQRFRIRSDQILVDIKQSNEKEVYYLEPLPAEEIRERIRKAVELGETQYNILRKNCEHFVMWLKYDVNISYQTQRLKAK